MYETPKSEVIEEITIHQAAKVLKWINLIFISVVLVAILFRILLFPSFEGGVVFRLFIAFMLGLFTIPYYLAVRAYSSGYEKTTAAKIVSFTWCIFIIVGVTSQAQGLFVNVVCGVMLVLSIVNIVSFFSKFGLQDTKPQQ